MHDEGGLHTRAGVGHILMPCPKLTGMGVVWQSHQQNEGPAEFSASKRVWTLRASASGIGNCHRVQQQEVPRMLLIPDPGLGHELMLFGGGFLVHVDGQMDGPGFCRHQLI